MLFALLLFFIAATKPILSLECNICGPGTDNIIGKPQGVLILNVDGTSRKQNCLKWQQGSFLDEEWCRINILNFTVWPCGCLLSDGTVLMDVMEKERQEAEDQASSATESINNGDLPDPADRPDGAVKQDEEQVQDNSGAPATVRTMVWGVSIAATLLAVVVISL